MVLCFNVLVAVNKDMVQSQEAFCSGHFTIANYHVLNKMLKRNEICVKDGSGILFLLITVSSDGKKRCNPNYTLDYLLRYGRTSKYNIF